MLRTTFAGDSSNDTNSAGSPRSHAAAAICAASVVFPVPDVPLTSTVVPRYTPPPSIITLPRLATQRMAGNTRLRSATAWIC